MSPYITQLTLPRLGESRRCASFYDLQARSFRAEKLMKRLPAFRTLVPVQRYQFRDKARSMTIK